MNPNQHPFPFLVRETTHSPNAGSAQPETHDFSPDCPFCMIAKTYPPISPLKAAYPPSTPVSQTSSFQTLLSPDKLDPPSFVLFSSEHAIAFLDIMPLTRGHVLVAPRNHRIKVGNLSPQEMAEIGSVLPLLARAVMRAVMPDIPHADADYNIVQNNGPGAAQVVPHVHFHIVPRPPFNYVYPDLQRQQQQRSGGNKYPPSRQPEGRQRAAILFGRGQREDLDYEDAEVLVQSMRRCVREEWEMTFGNDAGNDTGIGVADRDGRSGGGKNGTWKV
ncbi:hypothetical protein HRR83_006555 [Exophiala dermatitidis]|uniref:Hit-like protein n=2 Tax=Exophiala dermatitidis TaxID=5970 RepID=H6BWK5_EXODN|nr:hit-like protein [Exophiala dermatitidis NIH/UT8656]KAJ4511315.1 hypothetical protein HRR75_005240 [Exophiala dermatitidis]EHY56066.1 hit-like protein [Exophiala dermatitidis NIH/UT8656]KAJ4514057.1 hypothetical protein HRR74_005715 [Exophiala dermatitidis]KAJ4515460.1 hypothetical protein HRR73_005292 [Exophiala dermatitidis]KAJ4536482.1 hypothetical protein HRR77_007399 [Exophiala dermatitidis]